MNHRGIILKIAVLCFLCLTMACSGKKQDSTDSTIPTDTDLPHTGNMQEEDTSQPDTQNRRAIREFRNDRVKIKFGHAVNTAADEYLPVPDPEGKRLYFTGMDRTGFFDFKLDFIKQKSAGGEDIFYSDLVEGVWSDARPLQQMNTNAHEGVSQVMPNGDLLVTANFPEKLGANTTGDAGKQTTDIFLLKNRNGNYQIQHFPEPVNSIFTEADPYMSSDGLFLLFVADRPGHVGEYHKKGWKWNDSFWGNTDVYVSLKNGDYWSVPINLGPVVNSPGAERTPWLSEDGLTLFLSSNGYETEKNDLDVYAFKRKDLQSWTEWEGPFVVTDANSEYDDWGYKEIRNGDAFLASAEPRGFRPTQGGKAGDGGFRETNFRPGYELFGLQIASLNSEYVSNIFHLKQANLPVFIINDVFFDFDSFKINKKFENYLLLVADQLEQNKAAVIEIQGHTDNVGNSEYNRDLSQKRADAVMQFLMNAGVKTQILSIGLGDTKPLVENSNAQNRQKNRRVEIYLK